MKVLVVSAHPDDEVLGCGGTISRLAADHEVFTLILGEGITSRKLPPREKRMQQKALRDQATRANRVMGVQDVTFCDLPDNRFDTVPLLTVIQRIEEISAGISPDQVFTHHPGDLNLDHALTHRAVMTAFRPTGDHPVKRLLAFEVLSSTGWGDPSAWGGFSPNLYVDISATLGKKLEAMECYAAELRTPPHPRSLEGIETLARMRGMESGLPSAEAFRILRCIE
jgi:LmbE family N-acetylglucosaminyl deacetylase